MMTEIGADLVKGLFKERGIEFEDSDMDYIRGFFNSPVSVSVSVEKVPTEKPKKTKAKGGKGVSKMSEPEPEPESPSGFSEETVVIKKPKGKATKGKGKAAAKPKCEATTAKGTPCSKCAIDGEVFCSVHLAASSSSKAKKGTDDAVASSSKSKKTSAKKKAEPPKHTHGLTSPAPDTGCDLCETHGKPFEIPEYEAEGEDPELDDPTDPTYTLEEEDFDEID
jgi:hypothetical protein